MVSFCGFWTIVLATVESEKQKSNDKRFQSVPISEKKFQNNSPSGVSGTRVPVGPYSLFAPRASSLGLPVTVPNARNNSQQQIQLADSPLWCSLVITNQKRRPR
jgi:hypothetical protein